MEVHEGAKRIIFSRPKMITLLGGGRCQTRRVVRRSQCPYGEPGGYLWIRETWAVADELANGYALDQAVCVGYRADLAAVAHEDVSRLLDTTAWNWEHSSVRWRSPRFMPKWATRMEARHISLRQERLQAISEEDALAEGVPTSAAEAERMGLRAATWRRLWPSGPRAFFAELWDTINGRRRGCGWDDDPMVWVVECEPTKVLSPLTEGPRCFP